MLEEELLNLQAHEQLRSLRVFSPEPGPYAAKDGAKLLLFCGNDYLGLSQHPRMIEAVRSAALRYGVGAGASRLISGTSDLHARTEARLAALKKKPRALLFSSGYAANLGILSSLAGKEDLIVMDKLCHASLIDGARFSGAHLRIFPHLGYDRLEKILKAASKFRRKIIVTDSVFSMDGDLADLKKLAAIKKRYGAWLIVDDAHGTGILGERGAGAGEAAGVESEIDVLMGTTSKALGCLGGFAAAEAPIIDSLINHARSFIYSTAIPAILCAAIDEALNILSEEPRLRMKLWANVGALYQGLVAQGWIQGQALSPIFPLVVGDGARALQLARKLEKQGVWAPAIRPPTVPRGKARLRITVSALHEFEDIKKLLQILQNLRKDYQTH